MVLVIPAAKSPIARNCLEKVPNTDSKPKAKSPTVLISVAFILEAVITMLKEINPPRPKAIIKSFKANFRSPLSFHFSLTNSACKKRL